LFNGASDRYLGNQCSCLTDGLCVAVAAGAFLEAFVKSMPAATFDAVGTGMGVKALAAATGAPLTAAGKPRVLYVGA